ncbi:nucleoside diphosphate kinase [Absidia repens]|uniref:Nucleoside diphosphate kinase n=1 Tax=Absidia repens TaxID=90262 RepID=A0A1X2IJ44_9FUNG|nr:nucleoside diphosphate kinase [Absidia repens]
MPPFFKTLFLLFLFYSPFLFIVFIPAKTVLHSNHIRYDTCRALDRLIPHQLHTLLGQTLCQREQTLAVIKPDGFAHASDIKSLLTEQHGFVIIDSAVRTLSKSTVNQWYSDKVNQTYYPSLQRYLTRGPVETVVLERVGAIHGLQNAIHASDSPAAVKTEMSLLVD